VRGITGGNATVRGITGGNATVRGITGGNATVRGITGGNDLSAYSSVAAGPVEWIVVDGTKATISVLGQIFATRPDLVASLAVGDYVVAAGNSGELADVYPAGQAYVPGVSPVRLRGVVSSVDSSRATLSVGSLAIDYASYLVSQPQFQPQVDDVVEVDGVQPAFGGSLLASLSDHAVVSGYQVTH